MSLYQANDKLTTLFFVPHPERIPGLESLVEKISESISGKQDCLKEIATLTVFKFSFLLRSRLVLSIVGVFILPHFT